MKKRLLFIIILIVCGVFGIKIYIGNTADKNYTLIIDKPLRNVRIDQNTAITPIKDGGGTFYIPYIQTENKLKASAQVSPKLPPNWSVKFILNKGQGNEEVKLATIEPFTVEFNNLEKGSFTLDAFIINHRGKRLENKLSQDRVNDLGIGDIFTAIGDSLTEGFFGKDYGTTHIESWKNLPEEAVSKDNRNFPQFGASSRRYKKSWLTELNDELTEHYAYPIFIMNEGWAGLTTKDYLTLMDTTEWVDRQEKLRANKWLIHLSVNDAKFKISPESVKNNLQKIIDILINKYSALPENIWLATPSFSNKDLYYTYTNKYRSVIENLISSNNLSIGPDFWSFFEKHSDLYESDSIHPGIAGMTEMARLWGNTIISSQK